MNQKRYHVRAQTSIPVTVNNSDPGEILNISACGALLSIDALLKKEELIVMDVELPDYHLSTVAIVVREQAKKEYGVQFVNLSQADKVTITKYIFRYGKVCVNNN